MGVEDVVIVTPATPELVMVPGLKASLLGMTIPAHEWNALMAELRQCLPLTVREEASGGGRGHPWQISPAWDAATKRWTATIKPGFVNGDEVETTVAAERAPEATIARIENALGPSAAFTFPAYLTELPTLTLPSMRVIGAGGSGKPPKFFEQLAH